MEAEMSRQRTKSDGHDTAHADRETSVSSDDEQPRRSTVDLNADLVQFYFRDIRPVSSLLTLEEEHAMAAEVQHGKQAQHRLRRSPNITGDDRARLESALATGLVARQKLIVA